MKNIILTVFIVLGMIVISFAQKTEKRNTYEPAYVLSDTQTLAEIIKQSQLIDINKEVKKYLKKHPILNDLKDYKKGKKYSFINSSLLARPKYDEGTYTFFYLKNGETYIVNNKKLEPFAFRR